MKNENKPAVVTPKELQSLLNQGKDLALIDTLPEDHFVKRHLQGARNACVYQVAFPSQVESIVPDRKHHVVLYGSSGRSLDAITAAEKLDRLGYEHVSVLSGGLKAWVEAGYPLEGQDPDGADETEGIHIEERTYRIDTGQSIIEWAGRNVNTKHFGTLRLSRGEVVVSNGEIKGSFDVDMGSIKNISLEGDPLQGVLIAHLLSDDFFFVDRFPHATFTIDSARWSDERTLTYPNLHIDGTLDLHGVKKPISFSATLGMLADGAIAAEAHFDIDRTEWGILYGSSRYFEHLGMHLVFDLISIQLRIVAR